MAPFKNNTLISMFYLQIYL